MEKALAQHTKEGTLYEKLPENKVRCYACGHNCLIYDGQAGICRVRSNRGGVLHVPHGYVGALQCDPIEKKPFFHAYPGSEALSFGMLGCDFHCAYCFTGDTIIPSAVGPKSLESIFSESFQIRERKDGKIGFLKSLSVFTHTGRLFPVRAVFQHPYSGQLIRIQAAFCPPVECTPDHRFLAIPRPRRGNAPAIPTYVRAENLSKDFCLAIPRELASSKADLLDCAKWISKVATKVRMKRQWSEEFLEAVVQMGAIGMSKLAIAKETGYRRETVRAVLDRIESKKTSSEELLQYKGLLLVERDKVRLYNEHTPGIPRTLKISCDLAELFGYFCAEGCVWIDTARRVNSTMLTFSFALYERDIAQRVVHLLSTIFGVKAKIYMRYTTCAVVCYKSSLGLLFEALCGGDAGTKRVPPCLFKAPSEIAESFLMAYAAGDGSRTCNGMIDAVTVSKELAYGVASLILKTGRVPFLREYPDYQKGKFEDRSVNRAPYNYRVRWYDREDKRRCWKDENFHFIPIRDVRKKNFRGYVYNLEVGQDHSYLAGFLAVSNCQNWNVSQALRDPKAGGPLIECTAGQLVAMAKARGARVVASTYNEPLITSEWAVEIFTEAKKSGFATAYISNGNGTSRVLDFLRPWVDLYKVDLKGFDEKHYRALGGQLKPVLETIRTLHEKKFWLEIVTLIIPGFNDSDAELGNIAKFLAGISRDIPWHVTAFHSDYKMMDTGNTPVATLLRACEIGAAAGLRYIYAGNIPGQVGRWENTYCPDCECKLITRVGFRVTENNLADGACPACHRVIPGIWGKMRDMT